MNKKITTIIKFLDDINKIRSILKMNFGVISRNTLRYCYNTLQYKLLYTNCRSRALADCICYNANVESMLYTHGRLSVNNNDPVENGYYMKYCNSVHQNI